MRQLLLLLLAGVAAQAQRSGLKDFLTLTPAQITQVQQLNAALDQSVGEKQQRRGQIYQELDQEYAKSSPEPLALGQRYLELDSLSHDIAVQRAGTQSKVGALLTDGQRRLVQQVSLAAVQQSLIADASCAYLADNLVPTFGFRLGDFSVITGVLSPYPNVAGALVYASASYGCAGAFPISIRNFLGLSDGQVIAIQNLIAAYQNLTARKQSRIADVQTEIRDETARPVPDPIALGVRYAELGEIAQELQQADTQARKSARAFLTSAQSATLANLTSASSLTQYIPAAESCHFFSPPAGISGADYSGSPCASYF